MTYKHTKRTLAVLAVAAMMSNAAYAAEPTAADDTLLDSIVITATKTAESVHDLPASVSVITAAEIEQANVKSAEDILRYETGFFVKDTNGNQGTKVSMRGMSQTGVLVLVDGMSINNGYTGGPNWSSVPVNMIERIEIVRGAGSALYGSNAMGGVINIITKKTEGGKATVGFGSHDTRYGDFYYGDKADKLFWSVNYNKRKTDGYKDNDNTNKASGNYGKRAGEREGYGFNLQYEVDANNTALFKYQKADYTYGYYESTADIKTSGERESETFQLGWQGRYDDGSALNVNLTRFEFDKYRTRSASKLTSSPIESSEADVNYSWQAGDHTITVGASYKQDEADSETMYKHKKFTDGKWVLADKCGGTAETRAIYLQDDIKLSDVTNLILGGRYDRWKFSDAYNKEGALRDADENQFSPKASLNYKANDVTSYYVSAGKAFNSPTIFNLASDWPMFSTAKEDDMLHANPNLKPETLTMYEAGVKFDLNEKTIATVSIYQNDVEDMIAQLGIDGSNVGSYAGTQIGDNIWENVGKARVRGFEAEVNHIFDDTYSAFAGYTFADSEIREYNDPTMIGNQMTTVPKHEFKLGVNYQKAKWTANLLGRYTSEMFEDIANEKDGSNYSESVFLADIKFGYAFDEQQSVALAVDNIFDREYVAQGYYGAGRAAYVEYSYRF